MKRITLNVSNQLFENLESYCLENDFKKEKWIIDVIYFELSITQNLGYYGANKQGEKKCEHMKKLKKKLK